MSATIGMTMTAAMSATIGMTMTTGTTEMIGIIVTTGMTVMKSMTVMKGMTVMKDMRGENGGKQNIIALFVTRTSGMNAESMRSGQDFMITGIRCTASLEKSGSGMNGSCGK